MAKQLTSEERARLLHLAAHVANDLVRGHVPYYMTTGEIDEITAGTDCETHFEEACAPIWRQMLDCSFEPLVAQYPRSMADFKIQWNRFYSHYVSEAQGCSQYQLNAINKD